jgi:hypothetical protein
MNLSDLVFDYGWKKTISIQFQGKRQDIELVFDAYKGEEVNEKQRLSYEKFEHSQSLYEKQAEQLLDNYIKVNQLRDVSIKLKTLLIKHNGDFGFLADCSWDIENGIAIILKSEPSVVLQDDFL